MTNIRYANTDRAVTTGDLAVYVPQRGVEVGVRVSRIINGVVYVRVIGLDTNAPLWGTEHVTLPSHTLTWSE